VFLTPAQQARQGKDKYGNPKNVPSTSDQTSRNHTTIRYALMDYRPRTPDIVKRKDSLIAGRALHQEKRLYDQRLLERLNNLVPKKGTLSNLWNIFNRRPSSDTAELDSLTQDQLVGIALRAFPPRMQLPVWVCDVMEHSAIIHETTIGDIERCTSHMNSMLTLLTTTDWKEKPPNVLFRWL
jgi:hypothetical protein